MTDAARVSTRPERLKRRADYVAAAKGRRTHAPAFTLQGIERSADAVVSLGPRFGLTVSRKVGNAVERNRVKRRLREVVRRIAGDPDGSPGRDRFDYVVVARRDALAASFDRLVTDLADAVRALHAPRRDRRRPAPSPPAATV